jgi:hypothetical protein
MLKFLLLFPLAVGPVFAQTANSVPGFAFDPSDLTIHHTAEPQQPFTVVGEHAAILGSQDGSFELWLMPIQVLRNARLTARLQGYDTTISLNSLATDVEVEPDHTTLTYSHAAITVRQHMFLPRVGADGRAAAIVLFEVHATRPAELTLTFDPSMTMQWPAPNYGPASAAWVERPGGSGYILQTNNPALYGVVTMPGATHGDLRPYQERAEETPMELHFSYDPKVDDGRFYPLLCGVSDSKSTGAAGTPEALLDAVLGQKNQVAAMYGTTAAFYRHFFDQRLDVVTPDPAFNKALHWAEIAVDQSRTPLPTGIGMTAGWLAAGTTARPGYGWFFGRDTLWSLYAVNSYGDFHLTRGVLEFLLSQQREDGKIMHELSQTASMVDWRALPYQFAAADATPLLLMAVDDYVRMSGDVGFLREHWPQIMKAYRFTRAHTTEGAMDNSQGTGWVEEWLPHKPEQEIYLVALDAQANLATARLAKLMQDASLAESATKTAQLVNSRLEAYRSPDGSYYRFSRNHDGTYEDVRTIFPTVAWWSGDLHPADAAKSFAAWDGSHFTVDWGVRSVSDDAAIYDPISYHRGSVWPLYTGWTAMAEYRTGRSLAAFEHLESDVRLTWLQDPGAITELLSGAFYQPLARSSSHQMWSSAMLLSPAIRGMFGLRADALTHRLTMAPQLPAAWDGVTLHNVAVGDVRYDVTMHREGAAMMVSAASEEPTVLCLTAEVETAACTEPPARQHLLELPLPAIEVSLYDEPETYQGDQSHALHILDEQRGEHSLTLTVEAPADSTHTLKIRRNVASGAGMASLHVDGGDLQGDLLKLRTPAGKGYQTMKITLGW